MAMNLGMGAPGMPAGMTRFTRPITPMGQVPLVQPGQSDGPRMVQAQSVPGGPMAAMPLGMGVDMARTVMGRREAPQGAPMDVAPITQAEAPQAPMPAQQQPMAPQAAPGGLGGLGGFFGQDGGFGDTLSAMGRSMMSSPNGWWTRGYGANMDAIEQRRMQERERASQAQAMEGALRELGFSPEEARQYAGTPEAAQLVMQAREQARQREQQAAARARADAMMQGGDMGGGVPTGGQPAQPQPAGDRPPPLGFRYGQGEPQPGASAQPAPDAPGAPAAAADPYAEIRARDEGIARLESAAAAYEAAGDPVTAASLMAKAEAGKRDRDLLASRLPPVEGRPTEVQEFEYGQQNPEFFDRQEALRAAGASRVIMPTDESRFARGMGDGIAERTLKTFDDAEVQRQRLASYERIGSLLQDDSVYTGAGGQAIQSLKRLGGTFFGIEGIEGMENVEAAERIRAEMFAGFRQEMLSGATSNADRQFILQIPPNVTDSKRGIALVIELQRKASEAAQRRSELLQDMIDDTPDGNLGTREWVEYQRRAAEISAFSQEDMDRARAISQEAMQNGPFAGIDLNVLPEDIRNLAIGGLLQPDEVRAYIESQQGAQP